MATARDRHQRGELEPEGAARGDPVPEELELGPEAAAEHDQPAGGGVGLHPAHRRAPVRRDRGSGGEGDEPTTTTISVAEQEGALAGVLGGALDAAREEVAEEDVGAGPEPGAEDAVGDEGAVAHPRAAGDEGREGADEADEAADEDRLAAVAGEVVLDLFEALVADAERAGRGASTNSRPSRRPMKKLVVSPAQAENQAIAISR